MEKEKGGGGGGDQNKTDSVLYTIDGLQITSIELFFFLSTSLNNAFIH